jgi:hypothetical protein
LLTAYYTSYITNLPTNSTIPLVYYYTNTFPTIPAIAISVLNSTTTSQLSIYIVSKQYVVTKNAPKVIIDLTADLAAARPGEEIISFHFKKNSERTADEFYQDCVNILGNVFISYSYKD